MSKPCPHFSEDELIIEEEDEIIVDESYYPSPSCNSPRRRKSPARKSPGQSCLRPYSKYDHRPRNVVFDGNNFVASHRRVGGESISVSDFESSESKVHWTDDHGEVRGHTPEVRGQDLPSRGRVRRPRKPRQTGLLGGARKWLTKCRIWELVVLGSLVGLLFGGGYRYYYRGGVSSVGVAAEGELVVTVM